MSKTGIYFLEILLNADLVRQSPAIAIVGNVFKDNLMKTPRSGSFGNCSAGQPIGKSPDVRPGSRGTPYWKKPSHLPLPLEA